MLFIAIDHCAYFFLVCKAEADLVVLSKLGWKITLGIHSVICGTTMFAFHNLAQDLFIGHDLLLLFQSFWSSLSQ